MKVACVYFKTLPETKLSILAEEFFIFSPQIALGESAIFVEIGKSANYFSEEDFIEGALKILKAYNACALIDTGISIREAFVKAKYGTVDVLSLPLYALADLTDPFSKDIVLRKGIEKMVEKLSRLGVTTLSDFKSLPLKELTTRFGALSSLCYFALKLEEGSPWPFFRPVEAIIEKSEFPHFDFYGELEPLVFKTKEHLDKIFHRLQLRGQALDKLFLRVEVEKNSINPLAYRDFDFDFMISQTQTKAALNIIKERLAKDFEKSPIKTPILGIEITVLKTSPRKELQKNIFHNKDEKNEQFYSIVNQLCENLGSSNVFRATLTEDLRPEKSWKKIDFKESTSEDQFVLSRLPPRPTFLVRPQKVEVTAGFLHILKKKFRILKSSFLPEIMTGHWFSDDQFKRTYHRLSLEDGPDVSVFQSADKSYYLHGYFD